MELERKFKELNGTRGKKRQELIKNISFGFMNFLRNGQYRNFSKGLLSSFIPDETQQRTRQRILKEVINFLESENKIKKVVVVKSYISLRNKKLFSYDYGSYQTLMTKNGYKMNFYKYEYDEKKKIPKRVKVGSCKVGQTISQDYDEGDSVSYKPRSRQGVYTNSPFSVVKEKDLRKVISYQVL